MKVTISNVPWCVRIRNQLILSKELRFWRSLRIRYCESSVKGYREENLQSYGVSMVTLCSDNMHSRKEQHGNYLTCNQLYYRSQWSCGLKHSLSPPVQIVVSWVRIPLEQMFVCFNYVAVNMVSVGSGPTAGWSPIQGLLPTAWLRDSKAEGKVHHGL
jgi:hypothetical protein